jgi:hypothetical protein
MPQNVGGYINFIKILTSLMPALLSLEDKTGVENEIKEEEEVIPLAPTLELIWCLC